MESAIESLRAGLKRVLAEQHDVWREVVSGLDATALNWVPGAEMNAVVVLLTHALGAEQFLVATAVGRTVERDRAGEFLASAPDATSLLRHIDEVDASVAALLDHVSEADLAEVRQPQGDRLNRRNPGIWWLLHAVEHSNEHLGQAMLTRQLYEQAGRQG